MKKIVGFLFIIGFLTGLIAAEEDNFSAHAELSYANTAGNTESQDVAGNLKFKYPFFQNAIRFEGNVLYSDNDNFDENGSYVETVATKNRWDAELNYDYKFNEAIAFNYIAGAKGDKFSTFSYQAYTGPGGIWTTFKTTVMIKSDREKFFEHGMKTVSRTRLIQTTPCNLIQRTRSLWIMFFRSQKIRSSFST